MQQIIRPEVLATQAYTVAPAQDCIKLDAMENPYSLPATVQQQLSSLLGSAAIHRYPDAAATALKQQLRNVMQIPAIADVLIGNGSDELIQIIAQAVATPTTCLLAPEPGFVMYRQIATSVGCRYHGVALRQPDFGLDMDAMLAAIAHEQPAVIFIACPNNPTGNLFSDADLRTLLAAAPGVVVIDEAYYPFTGYSALALLAEYDHLLVLRTVSKLGLAGLRIGALIAAPAWIAEFDKLRLPYNIGVLNQLAACAVLEQSDVLAAQVQSILTERNHLATALAALPGVQVWPSETNFLLFKLANAAAIHQQLRDEGVLIKKLAGSHPALADCLRVTVGTPQENARFLEVLEQLLTNV
ncbi:MAG: histidinol-phosphate transaminase [Gammaproteobacteria bacterium]